jgi:hypothetical protein
VTDRERIEELEKRVRELERLPLQWPTLPPAPLHVPPDECPSGGWHDYPIPWGSITPPRCRKCGQSAHTYTITCKA